VTLAALFLCWILLPLAAWVFVVELYRLIHPGRSRVGSSVFRDGQVSRLPGAADPSTVPDGDRYEIAAQRYFRADGEPW
jgi:hypothetical protein